MTNRVPHSVINKNLILKSDASLHRQRGRDYFSSTSSHFWACLWIFGWETVYAQGQSLFRWLPWEAGPGENNQNTPTGKVKFLGSEGWEKATWRQIKWFPVSDRLSQWRVLRHIWRKLECFCTAGESTLVSRPLAELISAISMQKKEWNMFLTTAHIFTIQHLQIWNSVHYFSPLRTFSCRLQFQQH